mgnify:CR=1 FL=1
MHDLYVRIHQICIYHLYLYLYVCQLLISTSLIFVYLMHIYYNIEGSRREKGNVFSLSLAIQGYARKYGLIQKPANMIAHIHILRVWTHFYFIFLNLIKEYLSILTLLILISLKLSSARGTFW